MFTGLIDGQLACWIIGAALYLCGGQWTSVLIERVENLHEPRPEDYLPIFVVWMTWPLWLPGCSVVWLLKNRGY